MDEAPPPHDAAIRDAPGDLCSRFITSLGVSGASVTVFGLNGQQSTVCASDDTAARGDALQLELGEGPHWQMLETGTTVLCPDLRAADHVAWPHFTAAARAIGMAAVYAFPITLGAVMVGAVDLYSATPRRLSEREVSLGWALAGGIGTAAVRRATASADDPHAVENSAAPSLRREVHQATGMIQAQLDCSATEAFARLRAYAFATETAIDDIARRVVGRALDFSALDD